eukprot:CAMPEP_0184479776 /NCGR_PEP_ID=MMETSP0113_2-20130426/1370_1 /TAXON_ID=91329 /ORGANISM="Norrisiella sphaerica, Strain BC52" /LENGTH=105 /DNA_ID=CAMNT_0026857927 /DNA_START=81 /DNA_END=398 /DNA_ORIENTATION=+
MKVSLQNVKKVQIFSHSHKKESTGVRKFVKEFLPALKYHNSDVIFENKNEQNTSPLIELSFEDDVVQKLDCSGIRKEKILEDLLKADENFKAKEKVEFFGKEIKI